MTDLVPWHLERVPHAACVAKAERVQTDIQCATGEAEPPSSPFPFCAWRLCFLLRLDLLSILLRPGLIKCECNRALIVYRSHLRGQQRAKNGSYLTMPLSGAPSIPLQDPFIYLCSEQQPFSLPGDWVPE